MSSPMTAYHSLPQAGPSSQRTSARTAKSSRRTRGSTGPAVLLGGGAGAFGSTTDGSGRNETLGPQMGGSKDVSSRLSSAEARPVVHSERRRAHVDLNSRGDPFYVCNLLFPITRPLCAVSCVLIPRLGSKPTHHHCITPPRRHRRLPHRCFLCNTTDHQSRHIFLVCIAHHPRLPLYRPLLNRQRRLTPHNQPTRRIPHTPRIPLSLAPGRRSRRAADRLSKALDRVDHRLHCRQPHRLLQERSRLRMPSWTTRSLNRLSLPARP